MQIISSPSNCFSSSFTVKLMVCEQSLIYKAAMMHINTVHVFCILLLSVYSYNKRGYPCNTDT